MDKNMQNLQEKELKNGKEKAKSERIEQNEERKNFEEREAVEEGKRKIVTLNDII